MKKIKLLYYFLTWAAIGSLLSCNGFLDVKPDGKMVVPATLADCELLLNDFTVMNCSYPSNADVSADDYFLPDNTWKSIPVLDDKNYYFWSDDAPVLSIQWANAYKVVYTANQVIAVLNNIAPVEDNKIKFNQTKGAAYFFRAFTFHRLMASYALPYDQATADKELGIPLKLEPDLETSSVRSSMAESYRQIISDYKIAANCLENGTPLKGRPSRSAAFAGLARLYMEMQDYEKSLLYADSSLMLSASLLDYNTLKANSNAPIPAFNAEVLFSASTVFSYALMQGYARIDYDLYNSYSDNDLRKKIYFMKNYDLPEISYDFKGSYNNTQSGNFVGMTSSEMYLVKAEAAARLNKLDIARSAINTLLEKRYVTSLYQPVTLSDQKELLRFILTERRKELVFRGLRWADLRRLNQHTDTQVTVKRTIEGKNYVLQPGSPKYALLIPLDVIAASHIEQNKR